MSDEINHSTSVKTPWLVIFSAIITPLYGFINAVDIFYFGLPLTSALVFFFAITTTFIFILVFIAYKPRDLGRGVIALIAITLGIVIGDLIEIATHQTGLLIPPRTGMALDDEPFFHALIGSIIGLIVGFGTEIWSRNLVRTGFGEKKAYIVSLATAIAIIVSNIASFLQQFEICLIFVAIGIIVPLITRLLYPFFHRSQ